MILASNGIIASQIASFDADALAFFSRVTTAGGSLSTTEKNAVNQLVLDLKSYSIWSSMKAIYPMVGASAAACAQNLKSSSFTGTFNGGLTYGTTGVTPNGTNGFMNTGLIPNVNLTQAYVSVSYYSRTNTTTNNGIEIGSWNTTYSNGIELCTRRANNTPETSTYINSAGNQQISGGTQISTGLFIASRLSTNSAKLFKNNTEIGSQIISTSNILPSYNIYILCSNDFGTAKAFSTKECAFAHIGDGLTDTQASNFYTAVQAFQTTLSRQV